MGVSTATYSGNISGVFYSVRSKKKDAVNFCSKDYGFGFNGMEKDDEVKGDGNHYTTEFRHNDPRIGGRWFSIDPIIKPWESPYAGYANNPIFYNDPSGLDVHEDCKTGKVYEVPDGSKSEGIENEDWQFIAPGKLLDDVEIKASAPKTFSVGFPTRADGSFYSKDEITSEKNRVAIIGDENPYDKYDRLINKWGEDRVSPYTYYDDASKGTIEHDPTTDLMVVAPFQALARASGSAAIEVATAEEVAMSSEVTANIVTKGGVQFMKYQENFVLKAGWKNWANYMRKRGWTFDDIQQTLLKGKWSPQSGQNYLNPGNSMSIVTNPNGKSLIIDNVTKEIIHLGKAGYGY